MKLSFVPYPLKLRHRFSIANYSRTVTPAVLVRLEHEGVAGYGEAALPQYLGESVESVCHFLSVADLSAFHDPFLIEDIMVYIDGLVAGNTAAKAAIDIALHDLVGKLAEMPTHKLLFLNKGKTPCTSYTIGIGNEDETRSKLREVRGKFRFLKVKLGTEHDREIINTIRRETDTPLFVDINQGWRDVSAALDMICWLKEKGVVLVEQPLPVACVDEMARLKELSPLPLIADEAVQRLADVAAVRDLYDGINIKLMKCTGLNEARKMVNAARALGMEVMLGCMTETSCAISAAAQISPLADYADLDGNLLIANDPFRGASVDAQGQIALNDLSGNGVSLCDDTIFDTAC